MMRRVLLSVLLSVLAMSFAQEVLQADCAAPALLQADRRDAEVQYELVEEANSSKAGKGGSTSQNLNVSNKSKEESGKEHDANHSKKTGKVSKKETDAESAHGGQKAAHQEASKKDEDKDVESADGKEKDAHHEASKKDEKHAAGHGERKEVTEADAPKMPSYADVDVNKDGVLTPNEFQKKRAKVIVEIETKVRKVIKHEDKLEKLKLSLEREVDEMPAYEDLDKNRDGVMTPAEYTTSSDTTMSKDLSYKTLDQNSDGTVTPEEFKAASEKWAAMMTQKIQTKHEELSKARQERRQLEQDIDKMQSYKDLDAKRDGVVTPAEYAKEAKAVHGTWSVDLTLDGAWRVDEKAGAVANGLGLAGVSALFFAL